MPTSMTSYDVFLNFRGEDTRDNFISHLYAALQRKHVETYIDYRLQRGEEISPALQTAIEESKIYVLVFSENYASSTWCLNELTKILDCKKRYGRNVIPVFYKVDPATVRKQEERYKEAFQEHEERFKEDMEKVQGWKDALTEAAGLSGWDSNVIRPEHALIEEIIEDILKKLNRYSVSYDEGIIGIEKHIEEIRFLLRLESTDIRIIGICGMGGIGKTTISKQLYHTLAMHFDSHSLVLDVQEKLEREGIQNIKKKYQSELLKEAPSNHLSYYNERLKRTKALLILDDVSDSTLLSKLMRVGSFGQGSRIIMTSRDRQVLKNAGTDDIYELKELNFYDSLKLFNLHAFRQNSSKEITYMDLSIKVLRYAKGVPLALQILGSLLYDRQREAWESQLQNLDKCQDHHLFNVLKLSYDGLREEEKNIFLDIACFYRGHNEIVVAETLSNCCFSSKIGMDVLKDKCLISILDGRIVMHDLIQEMGREIVRKECLQHPGKRSRLFKANEIHEILKKNKGSDVIQCILQDINEMEEVKVHAKAFKKMSNLRMLMLNSYPRPWYNVFLKSSLVSLPDTLKILNWTGFHQKSLPPNFCPQNLVRLEMSGCHLEQLWEEDQVFHVIYVPLCLFHIIRFDIAFIRIPQLYIYSLPKLKRLNLSYSKKLTRIQDLSLSPNIEEIILNDCPKLIKVHSSILLTKLSFLRLDRCHNLKSVTIPGNILSRSPGFILLFSCFKLEMFSTSVPRFPHMKLERQHGTFSRSPHKKPEYQPATFSSFPRFKQHFHGRRAFRRSSVRDGLGELDTFSGSSVDRNYVSNSFSRIPFLSEIFSIIFMRYEEEEKEVTNNNIYVHDERPIQLTGGVPLNFHSLKNLCFIDLSNCSSLTVFPFDLSQIKFLKKLRLSGCSKLENFPEIENTMEDLAVLLLDATAIQALPSSLWRLVGLQELSLSRCRNLEIIPSCIGRLTRLCKLDLTYCQSLQTFPSTIFKLKLRKLDLCGCLKLRTFPEIMEPAQTFAHINLRATTIKELPSSFGNLVMLRSLKLYNCSDLESLPNSIVNLKRLCKLDCSGCAKLTEIPTHIGRLSSLMEMSLKKSGIVNLPESMAHLSGLKSLDLSDCKKLECIPHVPPFLKQLVALDCTSIRRVMPNSLVRNLSESKEDVFKFHFTNAQQLDSGARANIEEDARLRMTDDAYESVCFCFPGSAVPHWFPFRNEGASVSINEDLSFCSDDRLIGFALCVVFGVLDTNDIKGKRGSFGYSLKFECDDDGTQIIPNNDVLKNYFTWVYSHRVLDKDHIFMWKFNLESLRRSGMNLRLSDARSFTFEISPYNYNFRWPDYDSVVTIKECEMCPLYNSRSNVAESSS
ncbi:disease resistance protein RPP4-like [Vigna radiata var. radiata]|uniref:ADP-ribosyl cyclase/cyclic ADP-ribose hydrolase n=1 Tax=Vigna radiata var. radiata TaxID=3916 RepID=A0A3Q0F8N0_VIGRR|nr:disease resistance protein RPP4-like [Vigna radiata var. radiata]